MNLEEEIVKKSEKKKGKTGKDERKVTKVVRKT